MSFNTENRKISTIFQRSSRYIVPRYQRNYVWNKTNWSELINDIKFTIKVNDELTWSHFLGTIVLNNLSEQKKNSEYPGITDYEIVDGQQRLTTLYILFCTIYICFNKIQDKFSENRAEYIYNSYITSLSADNKTILEIYNVDSQNDLIHFIHNMTKKMDIPKENQYYELYNYFYSELKEYSSSELDNFLNKLLDINIVEIVSDQEEEIYNIFEVLNARGQKLKQMELLKNHIMKYIQPRNDDFVDSTKEKWNEILNNGNHLSNIDDLLNSFVRCFLKKKADNVDSIYKLIKEEVNINDLSVLLNEFYQFSLNYKNITNNDKSIYIEYFNIKRNKQIRSLLAAIDYLYTNSIISEETKKISFKNLRDFFFKFNSLNYTSNKTDDMMKQISYDVYHTTTEIDYKFLMTRFFLDLNNLIARDDKLDIYSVTSYRFSNKNSSLKRNNKLVKYILYCLYSPYQGDTQLKRDELTIEHLNNDDGSAITSVLYNLTLTSSEINGEDLKNKNIDQKIKILKDKSTIKANQVLDKYYENGNFDFSKRKYDMEDQIFNKVFCFSTEIFNLTKEDVETYFFRKKIFSKSSPELLELLIHKGKNLYPFLENDKSKEKEYKKYLELISV